MDENQMFIAIQNGNMDFTGFKEWFNSETNEYNKDGYDNGYSDGYDDEVSVASE